MVYSSVGVELTDSMTIREVTEFWYHRFPWQSRSIADVENDVIDCVDELIKKHGKPMTDDKWRPCVSFRNGHSVSHNLVRSRMTNLFLNKETNDIPLVRIFGANAVQSNGG